MALLVRKIARAKWPNTVCEVADVFGDAIADLRTSKNTLSTWKVNSLDDLDSAALALAASSKTEKIENICLVWIPEEVLAENNIAIDDSTLGDTVIPDLQKEHCDLYGITYKLLGTISTIILKQISTENIKRYGKSEVRKLLVTAYQNKRIQTDYCTPALLEEIEDHLNKSR